MSTGFGYDMILLSVKGPGGARVAPALLRAPRRPHLHTSPPKKRRGQRHHHPSASSRPIVRAGQEVTQEPTAPHAETAGMMARFHEDRTTTMGDGAPRAPSPATTLLPHRLFAPRRALPFGLDNAVASLATATCPNAQTYMERPMVLPRDTGAQQQMSELADFSHVRGLRRLGPGRYTITSLRQRLLEKGHGWFYAAESDFDSESDSVEPLQQGNTPGRLGTMVESTPLHQKTGPRNLRSYESSKRSSMKIASASSCMNRSSSRTSHIRLAEVSADGLERYIGRSSETGNPSSPSAVSLEWAKTSWRQQCCCEICPNRRTLKRDAFEMRCRLCSRWWQFSRPRAQPLDVEEQTRRSVMSQPRMKRRCQSISSHPLEGKRQHSSSATPSTTNDDTTHDATSTRIIAVGMGTQKSAVTPPTAAGDTTATRTGWPWNCRAPGCSAEQSAARRCLARFDPRLASLNTTARPSQSCGWQTSG